MQVNILYILEMHKKEVGMGIEDKFISKNSIKVAKIGDYTSFFIPKE
jgi:hypothetical protein